MSERHPDDGAVVAYLVFFMILAAAGWLVFIWLIGIV